MDSSLPPFGIRHLRDDQPYSIVQVSEQQYQTTVESNPDARLTYVDEDDGENVTIGSGFELKQRLEDPAGSTAPLRYCYNINQNQFEDCLIHLFDIQRSHNTRVAWEEHQARYDQSMIDYGHARDKKKERGSISSIDLNSIHEDNSKDQDKYSEPNIESLQDNHSDLALSLTDAIPDLVESLANVLQATSETLRKAAAKTRESDTSPIEDIMSGVSNIVTEIGSFGVALLDRLNDEDFDTSEHNASLGNNSLEASEFRTPAVVTELCENEQQEPMAVTCLGLNASSSPKIIEPEQRESAAISLSSNQVKICKFCSTCSLPCHKGPDSMSACHNCSTLGQVCSLAASTEDSVTLEPQDSECLPPLRDIVQSADSSILDQDTEDADFSRRYPPLMSLRRVNTVGGLREHSASFTNSDMVGSGLKRHGSWAQRYPHRPTPEILDAETQRRRDFARDCFPTQQYTPGPGAQECRSPSLPPWSKHVRVKFQPLCSYSPERDSLCRQSLKHTLDHPVTPKDGLDRTLDGGDALRRDSENRPGFGIENDSTPQPLCSSSYSASLPGAWPEASEARNSIDMTQGESSGAFFHRMMRENPSWKQEDSATTAETKAERDARRRAKDDCVSDRTFDCHVSQDRANKRPSRHRSFTRPKSNKNPFSDLTRSHTVSSVTNPASRLNRPFDPLYPAAVPTTTAVEEPDTSAVDELGDCTLTNRSQTSPRVTDRQFSIHRYFSPVWEEDGQFRTRSKIEPERVNNLDRNGESSSMYSPPPRHMRSVPNFATTRTIAINPSSAPVAPSADAVVSGRAETMSLKDFDLSPVSDALDVPPLPFQVTLNGETTHAVSPPSEFDRTVSPPILLPTKQSCGTLLPAPDSQLDLDADAANNITSGSTDALQRCLTTLQDMGYGEDDHHLRARLHVYAEAAHGDVMEAIDMIEEDKRAHFAATVEEQLREREEQLCRY